MHLAWTLGVAVVGLIAIVVLQQRSTQKPPTGRYSELSLDLCEAAELSTADPEQAKALFRAKVHGPLHDLASETAEADRSAAARMLEAKHTVEGVLEQQPSSTALSRSLGVLNRVAADSLVSIGAKPPECLRS